MYALAAAHHRRHAYPIGLANKHNTEVRGGLPASVQRIVGPLSVSDLFRRFLLLGYYAFGIPIPLRSLFVCKQ